MSDPETYDHVLVVDDDPQLLQLLSRLLRRMNVRFTVASNGREAFDMIQSERFDLVVSDVRMPVMDGAELLDNIQLLDEPRPRVVFLTGFSETSGEELIQRGAAAVYGKPLALDELRGLFCKN